MSMEVVGVRLADDERARLDEMAEYTECSRSHVLRAGLGAVYRQFQHERTRAEERARRGLELLDDLKERLGDDFYKGHEGVGFEITPEGRVMVHVGDRHYFREDNGELVVGRIKGGRAEFSPIGPNGELDWMVTALGEPDLN